MPLGNILPDEKLNILGVQGKTLCLLTLSEDLFGSSIFQGGRSSGGCLSTLASSYQISGEYPSSTRSVTAILTP